MTVSAIDSSGSVSPPVEVDRVGFDREDRREGLALQSFDETVKRVAKPHPAERAAGAAHAVHVDAAGAHPRSLVEEQAVGLLHLLPEHLAGGVNDLELALALERREIPPEARRVAHEPVGRDFEQDDEARLSEHGGAAIDELDPHRRLAGADPAFQKGDIAPRDTRCEDDVEPADACFDEIDFSHPCSHPICVICALGGCAGRDAAVLCADRERYLPTLR